MNNYLSRVVSGGLIAIALLNCREPVVSEISDQPPTQRIMAQTTFLLGIKVPDQVSLDTVRVGDTVYPVTSIDSLSFRYDAQQRLVSHTLTQVFQTYGQRHTTATRSEYIYQPGSMIEREGIGPQGSGLLYHHTLDSTGRRVRTYTKKGYSFIQLDSLRTYSIEGILVSSLQIFINPGTGFPINPPTRKVTIQAGNVTQEDYYFHGFSAGLVSEGTRFLYDTKHYAPLAPFTFLGETSRNALLAKKVTYYGADGTHTNDYLYTNAYDRQGRLVQQLEKHTNFISKPETIDYQLTRFYY